MSIIVGRAFGDQYRALILPPGKGKPTIKFEGEDGKVIEHEVYQYKAGGVAPCTLMKVFVDLHAVV
jgi:isocitrate dehydrogenase